MSVEKVMRLSLCKGLPKKISRKIFIYKSFSLRSKIKTKCLSKIQKSQLLVKIYKIIFFCRACYWYMCNNLHPWTKPHQVSWP